MIPEMTAQEFLARRARGDDLVLVDVREPHELAIASVRATVPDLVHIPMGQIPDRLGELDPARETVVLCRSGGRSLQVARFLAANGYRSVANLNGGILAWGRDVDPTLTPY
jgi:rhodanese-related sulfurtransferase